MNKQKIYDDRLYAHFVTFSCHQNRRLLDHDQAKRIVLGVLDSQRQIQNARILGYVLMPNHVHALIWFPEVNQLSHFVKQWKQRSSKIIRKELLPFLPNYHSMVSESEAFWQRKYYAFHIWNENKLQEKLDYIHLNPVRAGLAERATEWKWSSARHYEWGKTVGVPIEWLPAT